MARRIPAVPDEWGDFITCVLLHMLLPLLPILIEAWLRGAPSETTAAITASMYSIAIGLSSRNKAMLGLCISVSIIFSVVFGIVSVSPEPKLDDVRFWSGLSIFSIFLLHCFERYNRHVVDCVPFWEFSQVEDR